jgi:hypothetical protein
MTTKAILDRLFYKAAAHLTGRKDVQVRMRVPSVKDADGFACLDKLGLPLIEIKPDLSDERKLFVLCHECAHIKKQSKDWKANPNSDAFSESQRSPRSYWDYPGIKAVAQANEDEADALATTWVKYAYSNCSIYGGEIELEKWLKALAGWMPPEDYDRLIKRAERMAIKGAAEVIEFQKWKLEQLRLTRSDPEEISLNEWKLQQLKLADHKKE